MSDATAISSHLLRGEFACPTCGNDILEAVSDGTQTNFLCHQCWTCWHIELGYMAAVPVLTCPGCPCKQECVRRRDVRADQIRARRIGEHFEAGESFERPSNDDVEATRASARDARQEARTS